MIARIWHGRTPESKAKAYLEFLQHRAVTGYEAVEGCLDVYILRRTEADEAHFLTLTFWESEDAIREFAGSDIDRARYFPEDADFLLEFEPTVEHYEVHSSQD